MRRKIPCVAIKSGCAVLIATILAANTLVSFGAAANEIAPPPGFIALFNRTNLNGWWGATTENPREYLALPPAEFTKKHDASLADIQQHWSVENGELVNDGNGLFLTSDRNFGDFELILDYKTVPLADSGVYLRGCPQVQIWDSTEQAKFKLGADKGSGALWNNSTGAPGKDPLVKADRPFGEWNHLRILMVGSRVWVWLNDKATVDGAIMENYYERKLPVPAKGPIQLQTHGGKISWRNVFIREIASEEADQYLRSENSRGFHYVFNGRDFTGWEGPLDCCSITNGVIVWQEKKRGTVYTTEVFSNFVARLEFKLPPGGNNGLAIRYPGGTGDTAYEGMCECQVLDDHYEQATGSKIDPRQAHGSAYGMVGALRGYQHPIGEWNFEEVTVNGSTIHVELNGTVILNADLSTVTDFMDNKAHPGKDRVSGHFGFAGHNDPVAFRNISIKPLN